MRFTASEVLAIAAGAVWIASVIIFVGSDRSIVDIATNLITDIAFAFFIVKFVNFANERDRESRNQSRRRAIALSVQKFYQTTVWFVQTVISDGIASTANQLPLTCEQVVERAKRYNFDSKVGASFIDTPIPYGAFFISEFSGTSTADVYPPRTAHKFMVELAREVDPLYLNIFQIDAGFIPDEVVDSLTAIKNSGLIGLYRQSQNLGPMKFSYWPEEELSAFVFNLDSLQSFFGPILSHTASEPEDIVKNAIENAIARKIRASSSRAAGS